MHLRETFGAAALLALVPGTLAVPQATTTAPATTTSMPGICRKSAGGYNQNICTDQSRRSCLTDGDYVKLSSSPGAFGQFYMYYGEWRSSWDSKAVHVQNVNPSGYLQPLQLSYQDVNNGNGILAQCYYQDSTNNAFNCFNGQGTQYKWYYNNSDSSVGLALSVPSYATQFQAYWFGNAGSGP